MANVVLTSAGLDYVLSANNADAITIKVGYFLPVYDYRIDGTIQSAGTTSAFSAVAAETVAATEPFGEILWNVSAADYTQSDPDTFLISASNYVGGGTYNSLFQTKSNWINLYKGVPLSNHLSGAALVGNGTVWTGVDAGVEGYNIGPAGDDTDFFPVKDYYPVRTSAGSDELRGNFRCVLNKDIGKIRFNKIALYAVALQGGSTVIGNRVFFAECYLNEPIAKTALATDGFDSVVLDFQVDLHSISADWDNVFYGTSGDYWAAVPNGLHSTEKISIGTFDSTLTPNGEPQATVQAGQVANVSGDYERIPQIRIDYPDNTNARWATMELKVDGHIYLSGIQPDMNILPLVPAARLGSSTYPFDRFTFSAMQITGPGSMSDQADGNVRIRSSDSIVGIGIPYFQLYKNSIRMFDDVVSATQTSHNTFYGGDLVRDNNDLLVQTRYQNIYVLAGAKNSASITDDQGNRHEYNRDMAKNYEDAGWDSSTVFSGTSAITNSDNFLYNKNYIVARGGNCMMGPLELTYIPKSWTDTRRTPYTSGSSVISTKRKYMASVTGILSATGTADWYENYEQLLYSLASTSEIDDSDTASDFDPFTTSAVADSGKYFIVASQIRTYGDIKPGGDQRYGLGDFNKKWIAVHTKFLNLSTTDQDDISVEDGSKLFGLSVGQTWDSTFPGTTIRWTYMIPATDTGGTPYRSDVDVEYTQIGSDSRRIRNIYSSIMTTNKLIASTTTEVNSLTATSLAEFNSGIKTYSNDINDGTWASVDTSIMNSTSSPTVWTQMNTTYFSTTFSDMKFTIIGKTLFLKMWCYQAITKAHNNVLAIGDLYLDNAFAQAGYSIQTLSDSLYHPTVGTDFVSRATFFPYAVEGGGSSTTGYTFPLNGVDGNTVPINIEWHEGRLRFNTCERMDLCSLRFFITIHGEIA